MEEVRKPQDDLTKKRIRKISTSVPSLEMGKLPPQAVELEEAVLGALMLEKEAVNDVIEILTPESFYKESHQRIFQAIIDLFGNSQPIDLLTVTERLRKNGDLETAGGAYYITQLTNRVASSANAEFHARIISQKFIQRELIRVSSETIRSAYDETTDVFDLLDESERNLFAIAQGNIRKNYDSMSVLMKRSIDKMQELATRKDGLSGTPSGFTNLDRLTSGFQKSDLIVLAARPSMGKTALTLAIARNAAVDHKRPVAVFSLEMDSLQLVNRLISSETEIEAEKLRTGKLAEHEWQQLHTRIGRLSEASIFIDDTPALSVFELSAKCRRLKAQHNIELVIIDYLQLMTSRDEKRGGKSNMGNREQEISQISRSLKSIAKELGIPVVALSQLNRSVETRTGHKRPQLSDLRESGAIEQDADVVMFIYRPEYYGFEADEKGNSLLGIAEIIVAKHRNGATGTVPVKFISKYAKFVDADFDAFMPADDKSFPGDTGAPGEEITRPSRFNLDEDEGDQPF